MDRFDRQMRIPGWDQSRFDESSCLVIGSGWMGAWTVWALASMGTQDILWIGSPANRPRAFIEQVLTRPHAFSGSRILQCPFDIEYGTPELEFAAGDVPIRAVICCGASRLAQKAAFQFASRRRATFLAGSAADGGWIGCQPTPGAHDRRQHAFVGMIASALLADAFRECICPLGSSQIPDAASLNLLTLIPSRPARALLVGVGGIGVYAAILMAMAGYELHLVDFDTVEPSNLNRQGLFSEEDARRGTAKAVAAQRSLHCLFPSARIEASVERLDDDSSHKISAIGPSIILSAVDNAPTRLLLSQMGAEMRVPVVQAGTDVFAADCFTQGVRGKPLDEQMHGILTAMARQESRAARTRHCSAEPSYVCPGMIAGGLMALRALQTAELYQGLMPIRWRSGCVPREQGRRYVDRDECRRAC